MGRSIFYEAGKHVLAGLAICLSVAWWFARGVGAVFFGVLPTDLSVYVLVAGITTLAGVVACVPVAWRASRVEAIQTLKAI